MDIRQISLDVTAWGHWQNIGAAERLKSDTEIGQFLVQMYESQREKTAISRHCLHCHVLLPPLCQTCQLHTTNQSQSTVKLSSPCIEDTTFHSLTTSNSQVPNVTLYQPGLTNERQASSQLSGSENSSTISNHSSLTCDICSETFSLLSQLQNHRMTHSGETLTPKRDPSKSVKTKKLMPSGTSVKTWRAHTPGWIGARTQDLTNQNGETSGDQKSFSCNVCHKTFTTSACLKQHKSTHNCKKVYACDICNKTYSRGCDLNRHKMTHTDIKPFQCDVCDRTCLRAFDLKKHKLIHTFGKKHFVCDICGKILNRVYEDRHRRAHAKKSCDVCNKTFTETRYLKRHKLTHTGVKLLTCMCDICGKTFTGASYLKKHKLIHLGQKSFTCDICNKAYLFPCSLKKHKLTHSESKPFTCDICCKRFTYASSLSVHRKIHTGQKSLVCDVCDKQFKHASSLKTHKLIHTGQKSYSCDVCSKAFTWSASLQRHRVSHTGHKLYACDICHKPFSQSSHLNRHKKNVHCVQ